jgi:hypothetical protein
VFEQNVPLTNFVLSGRIQSVVAIPAVNQDQVTIQLYFNVASPRWNVGS